ncbi:MAG: MFS transporter [Canibacter sp.]
MSDSRGMRSGIAILGILLIATNLRAALTVVGPLVPQVQETTDLSAVAASSLVTIPVLCFAAVSPIAPAISRKIGLERSLALALIVVATGIVLRSITGGIWAGTVLLGAGVAVLNVLLPALVRRDVPLRISQVTSWYQVTQSVMAGIAAAFAVPVAGVAPGGWRFAFGMTAALAVLSLAVFWPRVIHPAPQRIELTDTGSIPVRGKNPWKTAIGWQVSIFMGLQSTLFYTIITWYPALETTLGVSAEQAGLHQGLFQLAGVVGSLVGGAFFARSRHSQVKPMSVMAPMGLVSVLGMLLLPAWSLVWILLGGLSAGAFIVMAISLMGLRAKNHEQTARLSGMSQAVGYLLAGIVPIVFGAFYDATGRWTASLVLLAGGQVIMIVAGLLASRARQI